MCNYWDSEMVNNFLERYCGLIKFLILAWDTYIQDYEYSLTVSMPLLSKLNLISN